MEKPTKRVRGGVNTEGRKVRRQEARRLRSYLKIGFGVADKFENDELKMDQNYRIISLVETFGIFAYFKMALCQAPYFGVIGVHKQC